MFLVAESWNLKLNAGKCVAMRFGCRGDYVGGDGIGSGYFLGGVELKLVASHRDLGVLVDHSLKFHGHISLTVRKASGLANLLKATVCRSPDFMVSLFVSHVQPILDYCSSVCNLGFVGDVRNLESVQRRWTGQITGMDGLSYVSRLRRVGLYSVRGRCIRADLIKVWKVFQGKSPDALRSLFDCRAHSATR